MDNMWTPASILYNIEYLQKLEKDNPIVIDHIQNSLTISALWKMFEKLQGGVDEWFL